MLSSPLVVVFLLLFAASTLATLREVARGVIRSRRERTDP